MTTRDDHLIDPFIDWLDAYVAGTSTPNTVAAPEPELRDICDTAHQIHDLDRRLAHYAATVQPRHTSWEDIMLSHPIVLESPGSGTFNVTPIRSKIISPGKFQVWERAASVLLAAAIVLAISAGLWRASGNLGFGPGDGPPTGPSIPFGSNIIQSNADDIDPADLPTAEDCTVEPLTVDEVIAIVKTPAPSDGASYLPADKADGTPVNGIAPGWGPPTQEEMEGISQALHQWYACQLGGTWFQIWALETPRKVQETIRVIFPGLPTEEEIRTMLENLQIDPSTGPRQLTNPARTESFAMHRDLIDPNPEHSLSLGGGRILAGYLRSQPDGTRVFRFPVQESPDYPGDNLYPSSCTTYIFGLASDGITYLVDSQPQCG